MSDLPRMWEKASLSDLGKLVSGAGFPERLQNKKGLPYPFFKVGNLGEVASGQLLIRSEHTVDDELAHSLRAAIIPKDSIGFAKIGMAIRLNRRRLIGVPCCIDNNLMVVLPSEAVLPRYLLRFLETLDFLPLTQSTTVPALRKSDLEVLQVPLPPLNEQHRIVAKLEKLLSRVHAAQLRLTTIQHILKRFRQAILAAACSGRLTADWRGGNGDESDSLPSGWQSIEIEKLLPKGGIFDGPFGSNLKTSDYTTSGVRVVRLGNIGHLNFIQEKESYISPAKYKTLIKHSVQGGDIIFASFIADEIRACVLPSLSTKAIAKADCFCLRPKEDLVNRTYLTYQLVSQETFNALIDNIHGATRPRINTTQLRAIRVRVCPLPEQQEIVRRVEALFKTADAIETRYRTAKAHVDKLTQSILAKAFRGELVPQDPNDEPASVLLERIRQSKKGASSKKRSARQ